MTAKGSRKWLWDGFLDQVRSHCTVHPELNCWMWMGGTDEDGYPKLYIDGKHWRGNRAVLFCVTGVLGEHAMHSCDTPPCMFYEHLSWGSSSDNSVDAFNKGRRVGNFRALAGELNGRAKLTNTQRQELLSRIEDGERLVTLSIEFGVSKSLVQSLAKKNGLARPPGRPSTVVLRHADPSGSHRFSIS